ncbi:MAG: hypothetical protein Q4P13_07075, partial [Psychrobacter sp.]|nr:hypothetical protein [Psychrobacter sp.]
YGDSESEFSVLYAYAGDELKQKIDLFESSEKNDLDGMTNDCGDEGYNALRLTVGDSYSIEEVGDFDFKILRNGDVRAILHLTGDSFDTESYTDTFGNSTQYKDFDVTCLGNDCKINDIRNNGISLTNGLEYVCKS